MAADSTMAADGALLAAGPGPADGPVAADGPAPADGPATADGPAPVGGPGPAGGLAPAATLTDSAVAADGTVVTRLLVPFRGAGSGTGPLTWGQLGIWRTIQRQGASAYLSGVQPVPPETTIGQAAATWRFTMSRHQALRTRLGFDAGGEPYQVVAESGELPLEIVDAPVAADPAEVARSVRARYESTDFDYPREWPVRPAMIRHRGLFTHAVAVYCHLALDAHGLAALLADLSTMDSSTGGPVAPVAGIQPLELARQQREPAALRQSEVSLRHWERLMRAIPPRRFPRCTDWRSPRYWDIGYHSPAALLAVRAIAARDAVETTPVLLAAFAVALARITGYSPVVTQLAVNNRFRRGFAQTVSPVAQTGLCAIDVAGVPFTEAVARAGQAAIGAYKYAYYHPDRRLELFVDVSRDRGEEIDVSCYVNDRRPQGRAAAGRATTPPTAAQLRAAVPAGRLSFGARTDQPGQKLYLDIDETAEALDFEATVDTHAMAPPDVTALLRGIEAVLVAAALDPAGSPATVEAAGR